MLNQGHGHYSLHRHSCIEKAFKVSRDRGITTLCEAFIHLMIMIPLLGLLLILHVFLYL